MKYLSRSSLASLVVALACAGCGGRVESIAPDDVDAIRQAADVTSAADDWPWWRGPNYDNHATGPTPPTTWSATENVRWQAALSGEGHSSPIVSDGRVFVTTADEKAGTVSLHCFDRQDGDEIWVRKLHQGKFPGIHSKNSHASTTPATDGERIFTASLIDDAIWVTAVDRDGAVSWEAKAGDFNSKHGYGSSPVLYKSLVIVVGDTNSKAFLTALDRETGDIRWRTPRPNGHSFATPIIGDVGGKPLLLVSGHDLISAYDPASGELSWEVAGTAASTANTLAWQDSFVFASGGYPTHNIMAVNADTTEVAWSKKTKLYVPSPLVAGNRLFVINDDGAAYCLDAQSGNEIWRKRLRGNHSASPTLIGDLIYVPNELGSTSVIRVADEFELVAENKLGDSGFASPVICGGEIFLRTRDRLYCIASSGG